MRIVGVVLLLSLCFALCLSGCTRAYRQDPAPVPAVKKQSQDPQPAVKSAPRADPRSKSLFRQTTVKSVKPARKPALSTAGWETKGPIVVIYPGQ